MIKPSKFLDLESCVINISGEIIKVLLEQKSIRYKDLYNILHKIYNKELEYKLLSAIDFLFLLGILEYSPIKDSLELVK